MTSQVHKIIQQYSVLKSRRSQFESHWREVSKFILPYHGQWAEGARGGKRATAIYDSTATKALRVLGAGLMAGMTSPARPWFRLTVADVALAQQKPVKDWLQAVTDMMRLVFTRSNLYNALHQVYEELAAFGTGAMVITPDFESVIHARPLTAGEYVVGTDYSGKPNALFYECPMTVGQVVGMFGVDAVSPGTKRLYETGAYYSEVRVLHAMLPREHAKQDAVFAKDMPYASIWIELGANHILRESGYKSFRAVVPRWQVFSDSPYGVSPAMEALGDIKELQHKHKQKAMAIDYQVEPPLRASTELRLLGLNRLPGGLTYHDATTAPSVERLFEVAVDIKALLLDIEDVRQRIRAAFYADLFLMIANDTRSGVTAREIAERHEEKLLMLGPVLERLHNEMLRPIIDITFDYMSEAGILPKPPAVLQGQIIDVEFVSVLAQAQKAVGVGAIDRLLGLVGTLSGAAGQPLWDKLDLDQVVDNYADMLGVDSRLLVDTEEAKRKREERMRAQEAALAQAQEQQVMGESVKAIAKEAAKTDMVKSAAADALARLTGYGGLL